MTVTPPAQSPVEPARPLARDSGPLALYAGALRHLAGRAAVSLAAGSLRIASWAVRDTARDRAVHANAAAQARAARHPSTRPRLAVIPGGYAHGRADLQLTHQPDPRWP